MFFLTSRMKVKLVSFMFREYEQPQKKTPQGPIAAATIFPNFLKFWILLLILSCLGVFGFLNFTNLGFPELDLSSIVYHFRRLNDIKLPMLLIVELNIFLFSNGLVLSQSDVC